ncbi:hypothetical protein GCM10009838_13010 [Catenulispora subtropica]|uniref:Uncharacterized protein n=1 Tax=Catenulispora subtropica TaxID=450798 RepID=A0ABP5C827_9ACTN
MVEDHVDALRLYRALEHANENRREHDLPHGGRPDAQTSKNSSTVCKNSSARSASTTCPESNSR